MTWFSLNKIFVLFIVFFTLISCQSAFQKEYRKAQKALHRGKINLARSYLLKSLEKAKKSSVKYQTCIELAELAHFKMKNYKEAIYFYQKSIAYSKSEKQTVLPNERQAFIYSNNLEQYEKAIIKYHQLLNTSHLLKNQKADYHIQLIQLYYSLNKLFQAELEVNRALSQDMSRQQIFNLHLLLGNIFFARKEVDKAIQQYEMILKSYPQEASEHKIHYNLSLSYEEKKDFSKALSLLKDFLLKAKKEDMAYIKRRIQSLQERRLNSPGFRIKFKVQP